jgi:hydrogenase maturation protein HypF
MDESKPVADRSACFHASMANNLLHQALQVRNKYSVMNIALCGGVFQNRILTELSAGLLENAGFDVHIPETIPVNDAGLSYGQVIEFAGRQPHSNGS